MKKPSAEIGEMREERRCDGCCSHALQLAGGLGGGGVDPTTHARHVQMYKTAANRGIIVEL